MIVGSFVPGHWCRGDGALAVVNVREGRTRPLAALRVRFAQATRRLRRGRICCVRHECAMGGTRSRASVAPTPFSVERELDPPVQCAAVGDNRPPANESIPKCNRKSQIPFPTTARAPSLRGQSYHLSTTNYIFYTSTWPFSTTARAHPSCDRLRGSLRSGDMSLREGRAPARPLPLRRFRSSGSSPLPLPVATGTKLPTINYQLPPTNRTFSQRFASLSGVLL